MRPTINRRRFLGQALGTAAVGGLGVLAAQPGRAAEPVRRTDRPKFKFSLAGYSYRSLLSGERPAMTIEDFIAECARMDLDGAEPTSYWFPKEVTPEYLANLKALAFRLGLDISGTAIRNDFCYPAGPQRDAELAHVKQWIEYAERFDAPVIRVYSGQPRGGQTADEAHRLCVEGMEECCEHAGKHGVYLALENHGGLTATAEGLLRIVRDVRSPWFGVNFDSGNFHSADPYAELAQIAPYALNAQIKVSIQPAGQPKQPSDFARLARMLRDSGYRGYIVLEYEEEEDPRTACPRYLEQIRQAFA